MSFMVARLRDGFVAFALVAGIIILLMGLADRDWPTVVFGLLLLVLSLAYFLI